MTLSDLAKCSVTQSVARSLCDSWASCSNHDVHDAYVLPFGLLNDDDY